MGAHPVVAANLPEPPPDRMGLAFALGLLAAGAGVLALALSGAFSSARPLPAPPPLQVVAQTPAPGAARAASRPAPIVGQRPAGVSLGDRMNRGHVPARWVAGFYPLYDRAARAFGLNWLLLASVHQQETAFSTSPGTYHGLNFARCCGGPMQFNVTNGPVTTWDRVSDAYRYAARPASYPHPTARHPSIYDDFDAMMAGARLLAADGAAVALDFAAWQAAYAYYGHDATGVTYADQVLARAIGWSQHGFCINCPLDRQLLAAVHAAYGAPVLAALSRRRAPAPAR
jgi:hypothetical protein